jgi:hypothetical protein
MSVDVERMNKSSLCSIVPVLVACAAWASAVPASAQDDAWRLDVSEPITYYIAEATPGSGVSEEDRTMARWALDAWGAQANPPVRFEPGDRGTATIRIFWAPMVGGTYGEMRARRIEGRRGADVFVRPDTDGLGPGVAAAASRDRLYQDTIVYLTCVHELGHAFGLVHTRAYADIMYSFQWGGDVVAYFRRFRDQLDELRSIPDADPFSEGDRAAFRALYQ